VVPPHTERRGQQMASDAYGRSQLLTGRFPRLRMLTDRRGNGLDLRQPRLLAYPEGFRAVKRSRQARSQRRHASAQTRQ
jgi:hypothetical protein